MNVVLVGFRCSGKSTIGRRIAERLGAEFVDADAYLEERRGRSIERIFEQHGETVFRLWESDVLNDLSKRDNVVIATGGGAVLKYKNIRNLKRNGRIVFLDICPDVACERIQADEEGRSRRPALSDQTLIAEVVEQINLRRPYYLSVADHTVDTSFSSISATMDDILSFLRDFGYDADSGDDVED